MDAKEQIKICKEVAAAMATVEPEEFWADALPDYVSVEDRYIGNDWYIGTLPDGSTIWATQEEYEPIDYRHYRIHDPDDRY